MIPQKNTVVVEGIGGAPSRQMGIAQESLGHIMTVLGNLYSNPILAIIREYSTNAMDSHIAAGKEKTPIKVALPTVSVPFFTVEDFGTGLTEDEIYSIYGSYGASTKRESNAFNGQLGFGCKSAFSYTDQFTIISTKDGTRRTVVFSLDANGLGEMTKMAEETVSEPNGVKVTVPVKIKDVSLFIGTARSFYEHWEIIPEGIEVQTKVYDYDRTTKDGRYRIVVPDLRSTYTGSIQIAMGNVVYPVPDENLREFHRLTDNRFQSVSAVIFVPMGEVNFAPSRESLKLSPAIPLILKETFEVIYAEAMADVNAKISGAKDYIEAKKIYRIDISNTYAALLGDFKKTLKYKGFVLNEIHYATKHSGVVYNRSNRGCRFDKNIDVIVSFENAFLVVPERVVITTPSHYTVSATGFKAKELKAMRAAGFKNLVIVHNASEITTDNEVFGMQVFTLDQLTEKYAPKAEPREKRAKGTGLYYYCNPKRGVTAAVGDPVHEDGLPDKGSELVVIELNGLHPVNKSLSGYGEDAFNLLSAAGITTFAVRTGNIPRLEKDFTLKRYEDAVADVVEKVIKTNPDSAKGTYEIPVKNPWELEKVHGLFQGVDTSDILDTDLKEVIDRTHKVYREYNRLTRAPSAVTNLAILSRLKGEDYVKSLVAGMYTDSLEVPKFDEALQKYPLLTVLSQGNANMSDVKDYINAKFKY